MNKMFARVTVAAGLAMSSALALAQSAPSGITAPLDSIDLSAVATKVGAIALLIVGIALVFKGPALAKRVIRQV